MVSTKTEAGLTLGRKSLTLSRLYNKPRRKTKMSCRITRIGGELLLRVPLRRSRMMSRI